MKLVSSTVSSSSSCLRASTSLDRSWASLGCWHCEADGRRISQLSEEGRHEKMCGYLQMVKNDGMEIYTFVEKFSTEFFSFFSKLFLQLFSSLKNSLKNILVLISRTRRSLSFAAECLNILKASLWSCYRYSCSFWVQVYSSLNLYRAAWSCLYIGNTCVQKLKIDVSDCFSLLCFGI